MPDDAAPRPGPFDLDKLKELVELMEQHGLTEVNLRHGDEKWLLRRGAPEAAVVVPPNPIVGTAPVPGAAAAAPSPADAQTVDDDTLLIRSPTVGTFYAAPTPDDPPFVKVGSKVEPETIVCIVEAMKVFNQIPAELSGTIVEILVNNGDPVEFNQPLFRVKPG